MAEGDRNEGGGGRVDGVPLAGVTERGGLLARVATTPAAGVTERCGTRLEAAAAGTWLDGAAGVPLEGVTERFGIGLVRAAGVPLAGVTERSGTWLGRAVGGELGRAAGVPLAGVTERAGGFERAAGMPFAGVTERAGGLDRAAGMPFAGVTERAGGFERAAGTPFAGVTEVCGMALERAVVGVPGREEGAPLAGSAERADELDCVICACAGAVDSSCVVRTEPRTAGAVRVVASDALAVDALCVGVWVSAASSPQSSSMSSVVGTTDWNDAGAD